MFKILKNKNGITLIALVITIIVLLILAGISISMLSGDNSILQKATDAKTETERASVIEQARTDILRQIADNKGNDISKKQLTTILNKQFEIVDENTIPDEISSTNDMQLKTSDGKYIINLSEIYNGSFTNANSGEGETLLGPNGKPLVNQTTVAEITETKIIGEDALGNQVVIPEGFKLAQGTSGSGETVKQGIVIEDSEGNQYVWIPVSNINHDGSNKIKVNSADEEGVEITLGRYTFATSSPGNPTLAANSYQYANSYATPVKIGSYYQELTTPIKSNYSSGTNGKNTTAKNLQGFVESVQDNKGYYIARYEASYRADGKAGSIPSTSSNETLALTHAPSSRTAGDLWNFVRQGEAATACYDLYSTVNSDLMNSYAWDTAIVYIQAMGNTNYANQNRGSNTTLKNTGDTEDEVCKIFDMAGNGTEWTTENSTDKYRTNAYPCVCRGGYFNYDRAYTSFRNSVTAAATNISDSFRPALYL